MPARRILAVAVAILVPATAAAFENTGSVVADALLRSLEASGYTALSVERTERADASTVLSGVTASGTDGGALSIARIVIDDGLVDADNALIAARIAYEDTRVADAAGREASTVERIVVDGVRLDAGENGAEGLAALLGSFETVSVAGIEARTETGEAVTVDAIAAAAEDDGEDGGLGGRLSVTGLSFDVSLWQEPAAGTIRALGYERLVLDLVAAGSWRAGTGRASVRELSLSGEGIGTLALSAEVDGFKAANLAALQESLEDVPRLLEVLQGLSVSSLSLAYSDAGLVDRLMERTASEAGVQRSALASGFARELRRTVEPLGDADFAQSVGAAVERFLAAPGTLSVAARPSAPVTAAELVTAGLLRPAILPTLLDIEIAATP